MAKHQDYNLIVVAHPDDETLFFAGIIQARRSRHWHVICVTDGNGDGRGEVRTKEFQAACLRLKVKSCEQWDFKDQFQTRLNVEDIERRLRSLPILPKEIYTHNSLGEYGHPHHQDVSIAVHRAFRTKSVWSTAYNCLPKVQIDLSEKQFQTKQSILLEIYKQESIRFQHLLPCQSTEGFTKIQIAHAENLYRAMIGQKWNQHQLGPFSGMKNFLDESPYLRIRRPF